MKRFSDIITSPLFRWFTRIKKIFSSQDEFLLLIGGKGVRTSYANRSEARGSRPRPVVIRGSSFRLSIIGHRSCLNVFIGGVVTFPIHVSQADCLMHVSADPITLLVIYIIRIDVVIS